MSEHTQTPFCRPALIRWTEYQMTASQASEEDAHITDCNFCKEVVSTIALALLLNSPKELKALFNISDDEQLEEWESEFPKFSAEELVDQCIEEASIRPIIGKLRPLSERGENI